MGFVHSVFIFATRFLLASEVTFFILRTYARAMLTAGVLNCSIMYCESMPCLI